jgi:hypothetical protein
MPIPPAPLQRRRESAIPEQIGHAALRRKSLKNSRLLVFIGASLWAGLAFAGPQPKPKPSGIVFHLFGPSSVLSNVLPTTNAATNGATNAASAPNPSAAAASTPLSTSDILHQMFVTGDPNQLPGQALSKGKTGQ